MLSSNMLLYESVTCDATRSHEGWLRLGSAVDGVWLDAVRAEETIMIPCYVGGKGKAARASTKDFKVAVFEVLESTGLGYDTRYRYYRRQYPDMSQDQFARLVCDPIEGYDKDWPGYRVRHHESTSDDMLLTAFVLEKDQRFRD